MTNKKNTNNPKTRNRYFGSSLSLMYNGNLYPASETSILNEDGTTTTRNIGVDANNNYFYVENGQPRMVESLYNLPEVTVTGKMPTSVKAANQQKQAYMRAAGYDVPKDGSWNEEQQSIWDNLTTKPKEYDPTLTGIIGGYRDKLLGNTTERVDPLYQGEVKAYNPDEVDWEKTRKSQNKVVNALTGTYGPLVALASTPYLGLALKTAPIATIASLSGGAAIGDAVNKASEALTGRDIGTHVAMRTPFTPGMGEMLNPGYYYGAPRGAAIGDFLQTSLTGISNKALKPITKKFLGEAYYANIRPVGYANNDPFARPRRLQIKNMAKDFLTPRFLRRNILNSNYRPDWFVDKENPTIFEVFRNDAHRLSMGLKPHQELLPDGKQHSLYTKKSNGNYDVDWDYIRHVKQKYSDADGRAQSFIPTDFPTRVTYINGTSPANGSVVANDKITLNGGYGTYTFNPNKLYPVSPLTINQRIPPTHFSTGDVTFTDTWNVQPLLDTRSYAPRLTNILTKIENKNIPLLSKWAHNVKNVDLVDALGGNPFIQETKVPDQLIYWYPKSSKSVYRTLGKNNIETLDW